MHRTLSAGGNGQRHNQRGAADSFAVNAGVTRMNLSSRLPKHIAACEYSRVIRRRIQRP